MCFKNHITSTTQWLELQELPSIQQQIDDSASTFAVLEASHHPLFDEAADMFWQLRHWPNAVQEELAAAMERIWGYRNRYQLQLQEDQRQLQQDLQQLQVGSAINACSRMASCTDHGFWLVAYSS
jgi:tRNA/tmRNA/rRNA uracil-C5-methylase (TrmA/RlmC/RlmD family)